MDVQIWFTVSGTLAGYVSGYVIDWPVNVGIKFWPLMCEWWSASGDYLYYTISMKWPGGIVATGHRPLE